MHLKMREGSNFAGFFEGESELPYSKIPHP